MGRSERSFFFLNQLKRLCSSFNLVFPVVVVLDEIENEVENLFRTEVLDVSE